MAGSLSRAEDPELHLLVDDFYFSALFDDEEIFPISDEKYAGELTLQEALVSAASSLTSRTSSSTSSSGLRLIPMETDLIKGKIKLEKTSTIGQSSSSTQAVVSLCVICMDAKPTEEMFRNDSCSHSFCTYCIGKYVATKIEENIMVVKCPEQKCGGVLEPRLCRFIVPKEVFERWEDAVCESMVLGSRKFLYCPFKDCSALLVDDEEVVVTMSECPHCHRLFCAQCNVAWHEGSDCVAFQVLKRRNDNGSEREDKMVMDLAQTKNWRRCPGCKFFVEKSEGCAHISCRCGKEFCYGCGSKWSSSHQCQ